MRIHKDVTTINARKHSRRLNKERTGKQSKQSREKLGCSRICHYIRSMHNCTCLFISFVSLMHSLLLNLLILYPIKLTLHSLCQDPTSPGGANPTYAPAASIQSLLTYLAWPESQNSFSNISMLEEMELDLTNK